jgi:hypothetical protein
MDLKLLCSRRILVISINVKAIIDPNQWDSFHLIWRGISPVCQSEHIDFRRVSKLLHSAKSKSIFLGGSLMTKIFFCPLVALLLVFSLAEARADPMSGTAGANGIMYTLGDTAGTFPEGDMQTAVYLNCFDSMISSGTGDFVGISSPPNGNISNSIVLLLPVDYISPSSPFTFFSSSIFSFSATSADVTITPNTIQILGSGTATFADGQISSGTYVFDGSSRYFPASGEGTTGPGAFDVSVTIPDSSSMTVPDGGSMTLLYALSGVGLLLASRFFKRLDTVRHGS